MTLSPLALAIIAQAIGPKSPINVSLSEAERVGPAVAEIRQWLESQQKAPDA